MGGRGSSSISGLRKMAAENNSSPSQKLFNAPWQHFEGGNRTSLGATLADAEAKIVQNEYETGLLIDEMGFVHAAYKGGAHSVNFGNEPASLFVGKTLTHNHPSGFPVPSLADIATPAIYQDQGGKLSGVRAATKGNGVFSLKAVRQNADYNKLATAYSKVYDRLGAEGEKRAKTARSRSGYIKAYSSAYHDWFIKNAGKYGFSVTIER